MNYRSIIFLVLIDLIFLIAAASGQTCSYIGGTLDYSPLNGQWECNPTDDCSLTCGPNTDNGNPEITTLCLVGVPCPGVSKTCSSNQVVGIRNPIDAPATYNGGSNSCPDLTHLCLKGRSRPRMSDGYNQRCCEYVLDTKTNPPCVVYSLSSSIPPTPSPNPTPSPTSIPTESGTPTPSTSGTGAPTGAATGSITPSPTSEATQTSSETPSEKPSMGPVAPPLVILPGSGGGGGSIDIEITVGDDSDSDGSEQPPFLDFGTSFSGRLASKWVMIIAFVFIAFLLAFVIAFACRLVFRTRRSQKKRPVWK